MIRYAQKTPRRDLIQRKLDTDTLKIKVFSDSSFANAERKRYQLRYIVLLCDGTGRANVLHDASYKSNRVAESTMDGEVFAIADGFDYGFPSSTIWNKWSVGKFPYTSLLTRTVFSNS